MGWFEKDLITNFDHWREAYLLQARTEKEEREFIESFFPKLLTYMGVAIIMVVVLVLLIPPRTVQA